VKGPQRSNARVSADRGEIKRRARPDPGAPLIVGSPGASLGTVAGTIRAMLRAFKQGDDNGLCGLTAVTNVCRWLWQGLRVKDSDDVEAQVVQLRHYLVFQCLTAEQFRAMYGNGDEIPVIRKLMKAAVHWLETHGYSAGVMTEPFRGRRVTKEEYWRELLDLIAPEPVAALIGLNEPWPHWTVATNKTGTYRVRVFDSDVFETIDMRRTTDRKTHAGRWELDPPSTIVVRRVT
jgi:hypothetical protein